MISEKKLYLQPKYMRSSVFILFLSVFFNVSLSGTIVIEGFYQGKNIYVQNFMGASGVGFCAYEVKVNGQITTDETNSSAFEIDLSAFNFKLGDKVTIQINHKDNCVPKILNPEDLRPQATFQIVQMTIDTEGLLKWTADNETGKLPYVIEQFRWNKWIPVGEVEGVGTPGHHSYQFKAVLHSGENKFRVKQKGSSGTVRYSKEITVKSNIEKPSYVLRNKTLEFSADTFYEIYDLYGMIMKRGYGNKVSLDNLKKGNYYLAYDNSFAEISVP
jgi:hypothetical protein